MVTKESSLKPKTAHEEWMESTGVPIHEGYFVDDLRTIELGDWDERRCRAAFLKLSGQEGRSEARVTEIAAGQMLPPVKLGFDEIVYVVQGQGVLSVWRTDESSKWTVEWTDRSMLRLPRSCWHQFGNMRGDRPARLLHYNFFPVALAANPEPEFFLRNPYDNAGLLVSSTDEVWAPARAIHVPEGFYPSKGKMYDYWVGNFFPTLDAWEGLSPLYGRGAGGQTVYIVLPGAKMTGHMSVFPSSTYKKAHRHGPGTVIVIPAGEGYSIMWEEGKEKVMVPWHEASVFVPPNRWFHQHFGVGSIPARYLAFHGPKDLGGQAETIEDRARDQIEYPDEDPWIRQTFEEELANRGRHSQMPEEAYRDPDYEWDYAAS